MKFKLGRRTLVMGTVTTVVVSAIALAIVGAGGIVAWEYSNSNAFCTNACHAVHPEEPVAHAASFHARVNCVECHMGRLSTLELMAIKPTHMNELWGMIAGYERPTVTHSLRPARESCEACHWPEARHDDTVRVKYRYGSDPKSTEGRTTLQMHTGAGPALASGDKDITPQLRPGGAVAKGIHWHIAQDVEYVALDPQKQKIPLVEVRGNDGKVKATYFDATAGVTRAQAEKMEKRRIDCIDCHNASGHPFTNPARLVDDAMEEGRIDRSLLPSIKARSDTIIQKSAGIGGPDKERAAKFAQIINAEAPKDAPAKSKDAEKKFADTMQQILMLTSFSGDHNGKPLTWKDFPNNVGHFDSPGCFRCHDGKHMNEKGEAVRLQCTLCHALPQVVRENGQRSVASTVAPGMTPPDSHEAPNWMHDHRSKIDDSCAMCHGPIKWGTDGGNFCANPACHGRKWPELNLDAKRG
jgi:NapC/NirT cytochrome c family protein